jgi:hypothetical protein
MKESKTYSPYLKAIISGFIVFLFMTLYFSYTWQSDHWVKNSVFLILSIIGLIYFGKPVLLCPHVRIENNNFIIIHYWVGPGRGEYIARSMYEIVVNKEKIRSFRFKLKNRYFQVTPEAYKNGQDLHEVFTDIIKTKGLKLSVITQ